MMRQQRVLFSSARRRRIRRKPSLPATTKDRIRLRSPSPSSQNPINADLVAERVTTRLEWLRSSVEVLWKDSSVTSRPDRYELVMDGNWWRWNLLLAISPGLLIVFYCEIVAKDQMMEAKAKGEVGGDFIGLDSSSTTTFWEDLSLGLQYYLFGNSNDDENTTEKNRSGSSSTLLNTSTSPNKRALEKQGQLQDIRELKEKIQVLEEQVLSKSQQSGIHQRRQQSQTPQSHQPTQPNTILEDAVKQPSLFQKFFLSLTTFWQEIESIITTQEDQDVTHPQYYKKDTTKTTQSKVETNK